MIIVKTKRGNYIVSDESFRRFALNKVGFKGRVFHNGKWGYINEIDNINWDDYIEHYNFTYILEKNLDTLIELIDFGKIKVTDYGKNCSNNKKGGKNEIKS